MGKMKNQECRVLDKIYSPTAIGFQDLHQQEVLGNIKVKGGTLYF